MVGEAEMVEETEVEMIEEGVDVQEVVLVTEAEQGEADPGAEEGREDLQATDPCPGTEEIATTEEDLGPDRKQRGRG